MRPPVAATVLTLCVHVREVISIDVINVYNVYKKFFVNAFIILSTFISIGNFLQRDHCPWFEQREFISDSDSDEDRPN